MDLKLKGRLALVTGSGRGIGKAIAAQLAREGADVILNARSEKDLMITQKELSGLSRIYAVIADVSNLDGINKITEYAKRIGQVEILINSAGLISHDIKFEKITEEEWATMLNTNLMSCIRLCRYFLPRMIENKYGRILLISSEVGIKPIGERVHYSVSKTAIIGLGRALAELTKGTKVTVNTIIPGPTLSEGARDYQAGRAAKLGLSLEEGIKDFFKNSEPNSLIQRMATVEEVASTCVYYCSEIASATNGAQIRVDGGLIRSI